MLAILRQTSRFCERPRPRCVSLIISPVVAYSSCTVLSQKISHFMPVRGGSAVIDYFDIVVMVGQFSTARNRRGL